MSEGKAMCGNCRHWRPQQYVNERMKREATKHKIRNGQCRCKDNSHHITNEQFKCEDHQR